MRPSDPFSVTDRLDEQTLGVVAGRLEVRARNPRFVAMLDGYLDAMEIDRAERVIDLGCGTGVAARAIARRPGFAGSVLGIDLSPGLVAAAAGLAADEGLASRVAFRAGDSRRLDLADASCDAVVAHTLVSHVDDPPAVLAEMARLVRAGGRIAIFDGDYASLTFANADAAMGREDDAALIAGIVTSPYVMRQMPRMLKAAGLRLVAAFPHVLVEIGEADYWASAIDSFERLLPKSGAMTEEAARRWASDKRTAMADGTFFGGCNFYAYVAEKP